MLGIRHFFSTIVADINRVSVIIASLGFFLAVYVAWDSTQTAKAKDLHDQQAELYQITEELSLMETQETQLDPQATNFVILNHYYGTRRSMATRRGLWLVKKLRKDASPSETLFIAWSLIGLEDYKTAIDLEKQAGEVADNYFDKVTALRELGQSQIVFSDNEADRETGDKALQQAMHLDDEPNYKYLKQNLIGLSDSYAQTQFTWMNAWAYFNCEKAQEHFAVAKSWIEKANGGSQLVKVLFANNIAAWDAAFRKCTDNRLPLGAFPSLASGASNTPLQPPHP
jgi:hypothetical protein